MAEIVAVPLLVVLGYALGSGLRTWLDTRRFDWPAARRLRWSIVGAVAPTRYWWGARIDALPPEEKVALLASETRALGLERADSLRCPLCGAEIPGAWTIAGAEGAKGWDAGSRVTVPSGAVQCPRCDFRLDACRHCVHFLPGAPQSWHSAAWNQPDGTWGRCSYYRRSQPVEEAVDPDMARTLKRQGYEQIRGPVRIADSMLRPDFCRAFALQPKRLRASGVRYPGRKRAALLRILGDEAQEPSTVSPAPAGNEKDEPLGDGQPPTPT
jgi:hypothetical protein